MMQEIIKKREILRYVLISAILVVLISLLLVMNKGFTGYAIFEDSGAGFDNGVYVNTSYNGSDVVLVGSNLTGNYTSEVFDASSESVWNNLSYDGGEPSIEILFGADSVSDIWKSSDGIVWSLVKDDYNNGDSNGVTEMSKNSSGDLFILYNQDLWQSTNKGITWNKVNDDFNGADSNSGLVMGTDSNNNIYIIDGSEDVYKSTDSGISFSLLVSNMNGGNGGAYGIAIDSSNNIFIVDTQADVWESSDGITWNLIKDDYNGAVGNHATDMFVNGSDDLFILDVQDLWQSVDSGVTWILVNDDFNGADSNNGIVMGIDSNNNLYIIDGSEDVYKSTDSGISFSLLASNFNGANGNVFGFASAIYSSSLSFYVKNCSLSDCSDGVWQSVDLNNINLIGRYFQYKVIFISPDTSITPALKSVNVDYSVINTAPILNLDFPQEGTTYGYNESLALNFSVSDSDGNLDSCWYNIDNGENVSIAGCLNTTFNAAGNGNYVLNIFANDSGGEEVSDSANFSVAVGAPTIILNSPINVYFNNGNFIEFSYTPTDIDLNSCELWGDFDGEFKLNQTENSPVSGAVNIFNLNLADRTYSWNIKCVDDIGNSAFNGNKTFYVDSVNPSLVISEPKGAKTSRNINLVFSVSDVSPLSCVYNVYSGASIAVANTSLNCSSTEAFSVTTDADFVLNFYANDSAGNSNYTSSSFNVLTSSGGSSGGSDSSSGGGGGGSMVSVDIKAKLEVS